MRPAYLGAEASLEASLEEAAEHMSGVHDVVDFLHKIPLEEIMRFGFEMWDLRGAYRAAFYSAVLGLVRQNPLRWQQPGSARQIAQLAGQMAKLPPRRGKRPKGMSPVQVRQYHRRQQARGRVPGRAQQRGRRESELEVELELASQELEHAEQFWTKVTPIPLIGNKEGHEILTRRAMDGISELDKTDRYNVETGVIRPDRGGRSYWNFPRAALAGLKAAAQPSHALRRTRSSTVSDALAQIQLRFKGLYQMAMFEPQPHNRQQAMEWLGEALHLLQDSFSSAHVERIDGTGRIRNIRAFFVRVLPPSRSRAPLEHNAPSDKRDDIWDPGRKGQLRPEAAAAVLASRAFLEMALRHLKSPLSPRNAVELQAFINRYLST